MVKGFAISPSISKNSKIKQERKKNGKEKPAAWTKTKPLYVKLTDQNRNRTVSLFTFLDERENDLLLHYRRECSTRSSDLSIWWKDQYQGRGRISPANRRSHSVLGIRDKTKKSPFRNRARFHFLGYGNTWTLPLLFSCNVTHSRSFHKEWLKKRQKKEPVFLWFEKCTSLRDLWELMR